MSVVWVLKIIYISIILIFAAKQDYFKREVSNIYFVVLIVSGFAERIYLIWTYNSVYLNIILPFIVNLILYYFIYCMFSQMIGGGDIKILMGIGGFLGFLESLDCFLMAMLLFLLVMLFTSIGKQLDMTKKHPFLPYLLTAFWIKCFYCYYLG